MKEANANAEIHFTSKFPLMSHLTCSSLQYTWASVSTTSNYPCCLFPAILSLSDKTNFSSKSNCGLKKCTVFFFSWEKVYLTWGPLTVQDLLKGHYLPDLSFSILIAIQWLCQKFPHLRMQKIICSTTVSSAWQTQGGTNEDQSTCDAGSCSACSDCEWSTEYKHFSILLKWALLRTIFLLN